MQQLGSFCKLSLGLAAPRASCGPVRLLEAHTWSLKAAETDATKRALATFGNPFGLALYDRELSGVRHRKALGVAPEECRAPWLLSLPSGAGQRFNRTDEFVAALSKTLTEANDIEQLFAIWDRNIDTVRAINKQTNRSTTRGVIAQNLVAHLKRRAIALAKQNVEPTPNASASSESRPKINKSTLALSEPMRVRSKQHLCFVAQQPCVICGRTPTQAHRSLCSTARAGAEGERRIHRAALRHPPQRESRDRRRETVVAGAQDRPTRGGGRIVEGHHKRQRSCWLKPARGSDVSAGYVRGTGRSPIDARQSP
jgi:hypothetical protein